VGAELAIHGGDLRYRWAVVVGHRSSVVAVQLLYLIFRQVMALLGTTRAQHTTQERKSLCSGTRSPCYAAR
jgi:hypothetical protein